jgi:hypothetical protein
MAIRAKHHKVFKRASFLLAEIRISPGAAIVCRKHMGQFCDGDRLARRINE